MTRPRGAASLKLLTVNVNGVGSSHKPRELWAYMRRSGADVVLLQETHTTTAEGLLTRLRKGLGATERWRHELACSPAPSPHQAGVAILTRSALPLLGVVRHAPAGDGAGRVVHWDWDVAHLRLRIVCVYAPARAEDRTAFLQQLRQHLCHDRRLVIGGDWNCVVAPGQAAGPSSSRDAGAEDLRGLLEEHDLVDPWTTQHPHQAGYTHPATDKPASPARLDRWYLSREVAAWVLGVERVEGAPSDHHGVALTLRLPDMPTVRSPAWSFPIYILFHPALLAQLQAALDQRLAEIAAMDPAPDPRLVWEDIKFTLRSAAAQIHFVHSRAQTAELQQASATAHRAAEQADQPGAPPEARQAAVAAQANLREAQSAKAQSSHAAQAAVMGGHGERGTRTFHSMGQPDRTQEPTAALKVFFCELTVTRLEKGKGKPKGKRKEKDQEAPVGWATPPPRL